VRDAGSNDTDTAADAGLPGALEASGGAPETTVHGVRTGASADELSPEEKAIKGFEAGVQSNQPAADDDETAALAEGRVKPPKAE
jgi:hypothetical protein